MTTSRVVVGLGACEHCSRIKQRCDGGEPCSRCHRLAIDCSRNGARVRHSGAATASFSVGCDFNIITQGEGSGHGVLRLERGDTSRRRAAVIKRTRSGCTACKERKKKCDEVLPKCGDCKRLNLVCLRNRPKPQPELVIPEEDPSQSPTISTEAGSISSRSSGTLSQSSRTSSQGSTTPPEYQNEFFTPQWPSSDEVFQPIKNEQSPVVQPPPTTIEEDIQSASILYQISKPPSLSLVRPVSKSPFHALHPKDQHLLGHFIRTVSRSLSVVHHDDANPFLSLIVPLAGSSKVVMESVLALSGAHLRGVYPEIFQRGLSHQSKALNSLNEIISAKHPGSSEETLATILLLCMIEICDGNSTKWAWHISAAQTIIRSKGRSSGSTTTWKFLLAMFGYVDSVITISKCKPPLITLDELSDENQSRSPAARRDSMTSLIAPYKSHNEALFGVAQPLFEMIGKISALANRRKERINKAAELNFRRCASEIEIPLRAWKPEPTTSSSNTIRRDDVLNAAYAIKWASILRLHQVVEGYLVTHPCVEECTTHIFSHMSKIRFGSSVECILIFPLVMAAAGSTNDEQRSMVKERWLVMERTIGFENIHRAREMVEAVWKAVDDGRETGSDDWGTTVNWARIRYFDFPGVVLL